MQEEDKTTEQKAKANKIIRIRSALAAGTGLLPFPVLDAAGREMKFRAFDAGNFEKPG